MNKTKLIGCLCALLCLCVIAAYAVESGELLPESESSVTETEEFFEEEETQEVEPSEQPEATADVDSEEEIADEGEAEPVPSESTETEAPTGIPNTEEYQAEETEALQSGYSENFLQMASVLRGSMGNVEMSDVLTSYMYLGEVYSLTEEQLDYIASLIITGANPVDVMDIAYFWVNTCEDVSIIGQIYDLKGVYEGSRFWIENAYNKATGCIHGELDTEGVEYYLSAGLTVEDISTANVLSRKGVYTITRILDRLLEGESIIDICNTINGTSISEPVSFFGIELESRENVNTAAVKSEELASLENSSVEDAADEIISEPNIGEILAEKRSEKYANFTKELVNAGIVLGSVDEDLGVILSE